MKQINSVFHHKQRDNETKEEYWDRVIDQSISGWVRKLVDDESGRVKLNDAKVGKVNKVYINDDSH